MGRILIDTDELRSLNDAFGSGASVLSAMQAQLPRALAITRLNEQDPHIRAARIDERQHRLNGELARIADEYRSDGGDFVHLARRVEAEQVGGGLGLQLLALPAWLTTGGAVGVAGASGGALAGLVGLAMPDGVIARLRAMGLDALEASRATVQAGMEVGRSALDVGIGLLSGLAGRFEGLADWAGPRLRVLSESAWDAIWDSGSDALRPLLEALNGLGGQVAATLLSGVVLAGSVGRWTSSLPGRLIDFIAESPSVDWFQDRYRDVLGFVEDAKDWAQSAWNWITGKAKRLVDEMLQELDRLFVIAAGFIDRKMDEWNREHKPYEPVPPLDDAEVQFEETVEFEASVSVLLAELGMSPSIEKVVYENGVTEVTITEEMFIGGVVGIGAEGRVGDVGASKSGKLRAGHAGSKSVTFRFASQEEADAFIRAVQRQYLEDLAIYAGMLAVPLVGGALFARPPSLIDIARKNSGAVVSETTRGGTYASAEGELAKGGARASGEAEVEGGVAVTDNRLDGSRSYTADISQSLSGSAGLINGLGFELGGEVSASAGITVDASGQPEALTLEIETSGYAQADLESLLRGAGLPRDALSLSGSEGAMARGTFELRLDDPRLRDLARAFAQNRDLGALQQLAGEAMRHGSGTLEIGKLTEVGVDAGLSGAKGVRVGVDFSSTTTRFTPTHRLTL